jgi:hypothetical protein
MVPDGLGPGFFKHGAGWAVFFVNALKPLGQRWRYLPYMHNFSLGWFFVDLTAISL